MTVLIEGRHPGEFLMSEANGQRSRENITIASGSGIIAPGTVLGLITSGPDASQYTASPHAAGEPDLGTQVAVAIALYGCDASAQTAQISAVIRDAEVNANVLLYHPSIDDAPKRAAKAVQLAVHGIIVR